MTKAIIFDLDSCLAAADEPGEALFAPAFAAMEAANQGTLPEAALRAAFAECWRIAFDVVAERHHFSPAMRRAGGETFRKIEVTQPMHGYGDLAVLRELPAQLYLVTSGFRRLQESKIRALGIGGYFAGIHIDAIDDPVPEGKFGIFQKLLAQGGWQPEEVVVVGDNPDAEIEAGNRLGMKTIQILRPGVQRSSRAQRHIRDLHALKALL